jgi:hypothetical protein
MRKIGFVSTGVLLVMLGVTTLPYAKAQDKDKQEQEKGKQREGQNREGQQRGQQQQQQRPQNPQQVPRQPQPEQGRIRQQTQQQEQGRQQQQQRGQQQQQQQEQVRRQQVPRQEQGNRPTEQARRGQGEQRGVWQEHRARSFQAEHRTWQQRGGYNGYRIPQDRYRGYFGPSHGFRIYSYPVVVIGGYPRFQYGGFWLSVLDPWPEYWEDNWYDNDDVYIDYSDDGYYLYNRRYPRDRIAISVSLN